MSKIIRWDTPFTDVRFSSVEIFTTFEQDEYNVLKVLISPHIEYPKYLINFGHVIAFTCMEELGAPDLNFDSDLEKDIEPYLSAYQYIDSPWLKAYEGLLDFIPSEHLAGHLGYFSHYMIFGGDNNVEVITPYELSIEIIEEKRLFKIEREL